MGVELKPAGLYQDLKRLQKRGKILKIITQSYYDLHNEVGLTDVVELHGNVNHNHCSECGKEFTLEYIKAQKGVPLCDECKAAIRPGVLLFGETIHNDLMTEAVNAW